MKQSAFADGGNWYKGNLHTHSTMSDGKFTPQERAKMYREHGYSFLALTDHNIFVTYPELCSEDFLMIPGIERDIPNPDEHYFWLHAVGLSEKEIPEKICRKLRRFSLDYETPWQTVIDEMRNAGMIVSLAHPLWSRNTPEQFLNLDGYIGIEVFNTLCEMDGHTGTADYFIDCCLRGGKKVFLFAVDDSHSLPTHPNDFFGGWIQVKAPKLTHKDIMEQILAGSFYASTGPEIYDFGICDGKVYVECSPCEEIHFIGYKYRGNSFYQSGITSAEFEPREGTSYIRCECVDSRGKIAYTNPIYF